MIRFVALAAALLLAPSAINAQDYTPFPDAACRLVEEDGSLSQGSKMSDYEVIKGVTPEDCIMECDDAGLACVAFEFAEPAETNGLSETRCELWSRFPSATEEKNAVICAIKDIGQDGSGETEAPVVSPTEAPVNPPGRHGNCSDALELDVDSDAGIFHEFSPEDGSNNADGSRSFWARYENPDDDLEADVDIICSAGEPDVADPYVLVGWNAFSGEGCDDLGSEDSRTTGQGRFTMDDEEFLYVECIIDDQNFGVRLTVSIENV